MYRDKDFEGLLIIQAGLVMASGNATVMTSGNATVEA